MDKTLKSLQISVMLDTDAQTQAGQVGLLGVVKDGATGNRVSFNNAIELWEIVAGLAQAALEQEQEKPYEIN